MFLSKYYPDFLKHPLCLKFGTDARSGCVGTRHRLCVCVCVSVIHACLQHGMSAAILHICCLSVSVALWGCKCLLLERDSLLSLSEVTDSGACRFEFCFFLSYFSIVLTLLPGNFPGCHMHLHLFAGSWLIQYSSSIAVLFCMCQASPLSKILMLACSH